MEDMMMEKLKIFTNFTDWYVARDTEHIKELFEKFVGEPYEAYYDEKDEWLIVPEDQLLTITISKHNFDEQVDKTMMQYTVKYTVKKKTLTSEEEEDETFYVTATAEQWAKHVKAGFLCSTEY